MDALLSRLGGIVGQDHISRSPDPAFDHGARHDRGRALCILRPANTAEVSAIVAACHAAGVRIVPQSGNTGLVGGSTADGSGTEILLSLARLRGAITVDPVNRSVAVAAGHRLSEVNAAVEAHGLQLPIDLGADPMIGGMIGANTGGARFIRHGDMRRSVMGVEVVLPDAQGTVLNLLYPLRKNNTGLDWKHLFIGTGGAFGIVTRAVIEVQRLPRQTATALVVPRDEFAIPELLMAIEEAAGDLLTAFEGMSGEAMQAAFAHVPSLRNPFADGRVPQFAILVELARSNTPLPAEQSLDDLLQGVLAEIWQSPAAPVADAILGRGEAFWHLRHALSEGVKAAGALAAFDLSFARGDLGQFRAAARAMIARDFPMARVCDFGHVGDGALHFNVVWPENPPSAKEREALRLSVYRLAVEDFGGSFSAEHGIGRINQDIYDCYTPDILRDLADRLHRSFGDTPMGALRLGTSSSTIKAANP